MHVWVVGKGIPASKNKKVPGGYLGEGRSGKSKCKGPEMLAAKLNTGLQTIPETLGAGVL